MRDPQAENITVLIIALIFGLVLIAACDSTMNNALDVYDIDNSGDLSDDELIQAENDYKSGRITETEFGTIMRLAVTPTLTDEGVMLPPPEEIETPEPVIVEPTPTPTPTLALPEEPEHPTIAEKHPVITAIIVVLTIAAAGVAMGMKKN